jgi:hypothetical protein
MSRHCWQRNQFGDPFLLALDRLTVSGFWPNCYTTQLLFKYHKWA